MSRYERPRFSEIRRSQTFCDSMSTSAERRRCPKCGRKSALIRNHLPSDVITACRWCDYVRLIDFDRC